MHNLIRTLIAVFAALLTSAAAFAVPTVNVTPAVGPPTAKITVTGAGFPASVLIEIYFDTANLCLTVTNGSGAYSCKITVPKEAQPQQHWVTAVRRYSGTAAQKPFLVRTDMAQFHGRNAAHSGVNPFENTLNVDNVGDLDTLWSRSIGTLGTYGSAVVAGGKVYVGGRNGRLYAFDAVTGATIAGFAVNAGAEIRYSTPAVGGGRVFVGAFDAAGFKLRAYNAATGALVPGFPKTLGGAILSTPSLALGNVYVGCNDGRLYAYNATTGNPVGAFPVNIPGTPVNVMASPTVIGGKVYIGSDSDNLYAFDALTGASVLGFPIVAGGDIHSTVAASGATGFFGDLNYNLHSFRLATGASTGESPFGVGQQVNGSPAIAGGKVYVGQLAGVFFALLTTDILAWSKQLVGSASGSPMVANGVVYTSTSARLYALSAANGTTLWSADATTGGSTSPVVADGVLYYPSNDGNLYAFSVHGLAPTSRLTGGAMGVKPALPSLRPDLSLKAQ